MILRRILAVSLGILFLFLLAAELVFLQVGDSFLKSDFYAEELERADFYAFLMGDAASSALDEAREIDVEGLPGGLDGSPLVALGLSNSEVAASLSAAIPPAWVQAKAEDFFGKLGLYLGGATDEFEVTVRAGEHGAEMVAEVKSLILGSDYYDYVFDGLVAPEIEDALAGELPLGLEVTASRVESSARVVAPREWVHTQMEAAIDEVAPYALGYNDYFEIRVALSDRAPIAVEEVKELLRELDAYKVLYDEVIEPAFTETLGEHVELQFDIVITRDETVSALRQTAPEPWVRSQVEMVIDEVSSYMAGEVDSFSSRVSLSELREATVEVLEGLARQKVNARIASQLPGPEGERIRRQLTDGANEIVEAVEPSITELFSEDVIFTDRDLRDALSDGDNLARLDSFRELIRDGWSYTDADLRGAPAGDGQGDAALAPLDAARVFLADGWTYTHFDFEELIANDPGNFGWVNSFRRLLNWSRVWRFPLLLPLLLTLVGIGLLGGRDWPSRVVWASGAAAIASAVVLIAFSPIFSALVDSQVEAARETAISRIDPAGAFSSTQLLITTEVYDIIDAIMARFKSGVTPKAAILLSLASLALGVTLGRHRLTALAERVRERWHWR